MRAISSILVMPAASSVSDEAAEIEIGTSSSRSARRCAVTTISSKAGVARAGAAEARASAPPAIAANDVAANNMVRKFLFSDLPVILTLSLLFCIGRILGAAPSYWDCESGGAGLYPRWSLTGRRQPTILSVRKVVGFSINRKAPYGICPESSHALHIDENDAGFYYRAI
jgi:hypothetical protein